MRNNGSYSVKARKELDWARQTDSDFTELCKILIKWSTITRVGRKGPQPQKKALL